MWLHVSCRSSLAPYRPLQLTYAVRYRILLACPQACSNCFHHSLALTRTTVPFELRENHLVKLLLMAIRGQRFHIPLDTQTETDENPKLPHSTAAGPSPFTLVKDIKEKIPSSGVKLPEPPRLRTTETGFPAHRKRAPSKFKQTKSREK